MVWEQIQFIVQFYILLNWIFFKENFEPSQICLVDYTILKMIQKNKIP